MAAEEHVTFYGPGAREVIRESAAADPLVARSVVARALAGRRNRYAQQKAAKGKGWSQEMEGRLKELDDLVSLVADGKWEAF